MCHTKSNIYCLMNERDIEGDRLSDNFKKTTIDLSPYTVIEIKHDEEAKAIIVLT